MLVHTAIYEVNSGPFDIFFLSVITNVSYPVRVFCFNVILVGRFS